MNTIFLGIIAFVLIVWFVRSIDKDKQFKKIDEINKEEIPSYEEMVVMNDDQFKKWLFVFEGKNYRKKILEEMISFEIKNNFIKKQIEDKKNTPNEFTQLIYNLFSKDKSQEAFNSLEKLGGEVEEDFILKAFLAKVATDRGYLK